MLLYRIQHKQTKKFFAVIRWWDGRISWTETGAFYRQVDTIQKHLEYLMGEYVQREKDKFPKWVGYLHTSLLNKKLRGSHPLRNKAFAIGDRRKYWTRTYRNKLKLYRIVINDVLVKGERFVNVDKFARK